MLESIFLDAMRNTIQSPGENCIVVGVSGGSDSLSLLHLCKSYATQSGLRIHAAILNHGLRKEADKEALLVWQLCAEWALPVTVKKIDVSAIASKNKMGIEATSRNERYAFLADVARQMGTSMIAVAHHADDQAETVLMNMIRGTGMKGLQGMQIQSNLPGESGFELIRPLLSASKVDILDYCARHNLQAIEDESNLDTRYTRNRIRHDVIPLLETINPNVKTALNRMSQILQVENHFLNQYFQQEVQPLIWKDDQRWSIERDAFTGLELAMQRRLLHHLIQELSKYAELDSEFEKIDAILRLAHEGSVGSVLQIDGNMRLRIDYHTIVFERVGEELPNKGFPQVATNYMLEINHWEQLGSSDWDICISQNHVPESSSLVFLPEACSLTIRGRKPGERFKPKGMHGKSRKIKDWMIDKKIPQYLRDHIPLLIVNDEVGAIILGDVVILSHNIAYEGSSLRKHYFAVRKSGSESRYRDNS